MFVILSQILYFPCLLKRLFIHTSVPLHPYLTCFVSLVLLSRSFVTKTLKMFIRKSKFIYKIQRKKKAQTKDGKADIKYPVRREERKRIHISIMTLIPLARLQFISQSVGRSTNFVDREVEFSLEMLKARYTSGNYPNTFDLGCAPWL